MVASPRTSPIVASVVLTLAIIILALVPYAPRLGWASLYMDDVVRVAFRQTEPLSASLFRPFNEHLAPLFEIVTWATWHLGSARLENAPLAFTLSSYLPFCLTLVVLYRLARVELGDSTAALVAPLVFSLSRLATETVFWYSASSFMWSLLCILVGWKASVHVLEADGRRSRLIWLATAGLCALAAPAFCGLGLLAGPIAGLRLLLGIDPRTRPSSLNGTKIASLRHRLLWLIVPGLGTLAYLIVALGGRHTDVLTASAERNFNLAQGLSCVVRAPVDVLLPGLFGLPNLDRWIPFPVELGCFLAVLAGLIVWADRSGSARPLVLTALALILGGYGLTYPLRASADPAWVITVQRYHLLPQAGVSLIVALALQPVGKRLAATAPWLPGASTVALGVLLVLIQTPGIKNHARFFRYPEQGKTLAAMDRLADLAEERGLTREQVLATFAPIRTAWSPDPRTFNALEMLRVWTPQVSAGETPIATAEVGRSILAAIPPADREALCAGMDLTRHLIAAPATQTSSAEPGAIVARSRMRTTPASDRFISEGELAFVDLSWADASAPPTGLLLTEPREGELWWTNGQNEWSPLRSVTWVLPEGRSPYLVPLSAIPHWDWSGRKVRLLIRKKEPVAIESPRLLR